MSLGKDWHQIFSVILTNRWHSPADKFIDFLDIIRRPQSPEKDYLCQLGPTE